MKKTKNAPTKLDKEQAIKFIKILETADGGCSYCVVDLLERFKKGFPQYKELVEQKIKKIKRELKD